MEQLGIDPRLLVAQIINFGVIVFLLTKVLYKPVLSFLEKRKNEIAEGVAMAEKMSKEQAHLEEKKEKVLVEARKEARAIMEQAKKAAKEEAAEIVEKAQKQSVAILAKAKEEGTLLKKTMEKDMQKATVAQAEELMRRVLPKALGSKDQHALIAAQLKELKA